MDVQGPEQGGRGGLQHGGVVAPGVLTQHFDRGGREDNRLDDWLKRLEEMLNNTRGVQIRHPSHIEPPFTAEPIIKLACVSVAALATGTPIVTLPAIPKRHLAVFTLFAWQTDTVAAYDQITVHFQRNSVNLGTQFSDLGSLTDIQLGEIKNPFRLPAPIKGRANEVYRVTADNADAALAHGVTVFLGGWLYPIVTKGDQGTILETITH